MTRLARVLRRDGFFGTIALVYNRASAGIRRLHLLASAEIPLHMVKSPSHAKMWLRDRFNTHNSPVNSGIPWIARPCIDFLNEYLRPSHRVFEWGGGGSTIFFLEKGCYVATVESHQEWSELIRKRIERTDPSLSDRWDLRLVEVKDKHDPSIDKYVAEVLTGGLWDVIMIDGWGRMECLDAAVRMIRPGGILILDNADQAQYQSAPRRLPNWKRKQFRGIGVARHWVTQTDVYFAPDHESPSD